MTNVDEAERPKLLRQLESLLPAFAGGAILGTMLLLVAGWMHVIEVGPRLGSGGDEELPTIWPKVAWCYGIAYLAARLSAVPRAPAAPERSIVRLALVRSGVGAVFGLVAALLMLGMATEPNAVVFAFATGGFLGLVVGPLVIAERVLEATGPLVQRDVDAFVLGSIVAGLGLLVGESQIARLSGALQAGGPLMPGTPEEAAATQRFLEVLPIIVPFLVSAAVPFGLTVLARRRGWRLVSQVAFVGLLAPLVGPLLGTGFAFVPLTASTTSFQNVAAALTGTGWTVGFPTLAAPFLPLACEAGERGLAWLQARLEARERGTAAAPIAGPPVGEAPTAPPPAASGVSA